jgi:hypothetical protein
MCLEKPQLPSSPIARETIAMTVTSEMRVPAMSISSAREVMGIASAGLKAVAVQNARNR